MSASENSIIINITGEDKLPLADGFPMGEFAQLNAFLWCLQDSLNGCPNTAQLDDKIEWFLVQTALLLKKHVSDPTIQLEILSKLNPEKHTLSYTFKFKVGDKPAPVKST